MKLSDFLTAINHSKEPLFNTEDEQIEKEYAPFVVNRCLSYFPDTIFQVNEINRMPHLDSGLQFDYLRHSVRKRKRYSKWLKNEKIQELDLVKEFFDYSNQKAKEALSILSKKDIEEIRELLTDNQK